MGESGHGSRRPDYLGGCREQKHRRARGLWTEPHFCPGWSEKHLLDVRAELGPET